MDYTEGMNKRYFEDLELNIETIFGNYLVSEAEIIAFATKWDPQAFHIDKEAADKSVFGGLSAASSHTFAIMAKMLHDQEDKIEVLAGLGTESMKFLAAVRPGDVLKLRQSLVEKRESNSRPGAGIIKNHVEVLNQNDELVFDVVATALVAKRP